MSRVLYGDPTNPLNDVELQLCRIFSHQQSDLYSDDGTTYECTHHELDMQCVWNPYATSGTVAATLPGGLPANAMPYLRQKLLKPRQVLRIIIGDDILLQSPLPFTADDGSQQRYATDVRWGPCPISCDITQIAGVKSFLVRYRVQTWLNECRSNNLLTSNRWEMSHEIDQDFYTTRIITGRAFFRMDALRYRDSATPGGVQPDDFRQALFLPVPNGFKRERINVNVSSDGSSFTYTIVDREQPLSLGLQSPATRIEGYYTATWDVMNGGPLGYLAQGDLVVRAWGRKDATRQSLANFVVNIGAIYGFTQDFWQTILCGRFSVTSDIVGKYAEFRATCIAKGANLGQGLYALFSDGRALGLSTKDLPEELVLNGVNYATKTGTGPMPSTKGLNGYYLGSVIARALDAPCTVPTLPWTDASNERKAKNYDGF